MKIHGTSCLDANDFLKIQLKVTRITLRYQSSKTRVCTLYPALSRARPIINYTPHDTSTRLEQIINPKQITQSIGTDASFELNDSLSFIVQYCSTLFNCILFNFPCQLQSRLEHLPNRVCGISAISYCELVVHIVYNEHNGTNLVY